MLLLVLLLLVLVLSQAGYTGPAHWAQEAHSTKKAQFNLSLLSEQNSPKMSLNNEHFVKLVYHVAKEKTHSPSIINTNNIPLVS